MHRLILLASFALAGCAREAVGPSLSQRPIERQSLAEPQNEAVTAAPAEPALRTRIEALVAQARAGQTSFAELLPRAQSAAAAAGAEGSETWLTAQQQLSAIESARAPTMRAVGELDAMIAAQVQAGSDAGLTELQAAQAEVAAIAEAQQRAIDALREGIAD